MFKGFNATTTGETALAFAPTADEYEKKMRAWVSGLFVFGAVLLSVTGEAFAEEPLTDKTDAADLRAEDENGKLRYFQ